MKDNFSIIIFGLLLICLFQGVNADDSFDNLIWCKDLGGNVYSVDLSGDGQYVGANTINTAYYFDSDGTKLWNFTNHKYDDLPYVTNQITLVTPSDDGQLVAVDGRYDLFVFDALGESLWNYSTFSTYYGYIKEPEFSRDGNSLVVAPSQREGDSLFKFDKDGNIIWSYECSQTEDDIFYALAISDDGEYIAAYCQNDYTVYFFDGDGTELWHNYPMHVYYEGISMSGDGEYIALSNLNTDLCIYAKNGTLLWKYRPHDVVRDRDCCYHVAVSHDGTHVIADSEYCLHYFDIQGNLLWEHQIGTLIGCSYVSASAISDDGQYVALGTGTGTVILLNRYGDVLWEYETGKTIRSNTGISFSNDGTKLAAASENGYVYLFDSDPVNLIPVIEPVGDQVVDENGNLQFSVVAKDLNGDLLDLTVSGLPSGATLSPTIDPATWIFNWTPMYDQSGSYNVHIDANDGKFTASVDIPITVNHVNRVPVLTSIGDKILQPGDSLEFFITATDPDGDSLTYNATNLPPGASFDPVTQKFTLTPVEKNKTYVQVHFEVSDGQLTDGENIDIVLISDHLAWCKDLGGNVYSVDLSGDGQYVGANTINTAYYFDSDGTKLWNFTNHKYDDLPYVPNQITLVTPSDDGQLVAVDGRYDLFVFDALGESLWNYSTFSTYYGYIKEPEFSRDGNSLVVAPSQREGDSLFKFDKDGNIIWSYECSQTEDDIFYALAISDDGEYIAAYCQNDYTVYFFDGDGTELWHNYPMYVYYEGISMSGDGEYIALSNLNTDLSIYAKNGTLLWKYRPHDVVRDRDCCYHVAVSHDGTHVIADGEYCLYYFDIQGNLLWEHQIGTFNGDSHVLSSAISDDGQYVAVGTSTGTVLLLNRYGDVLWEYETGKTIRSNTGISFSNDGTKLAAASENGYVYLFDSDPVNQIPVIEPVGDQVVDENGNLQFSVVAKDLNGDLLDLTVSGLPSGATISPTIDPATWIFNWTPMYDQSGSYNVHIDANDGKFTASIDIPITVNHVNRVPVLTSIGNKILQPGDTLEFFITATDPDGDSLTYTATNLPPGANFDTVTKKFTLKPAEENKTYVQIHFEVSDGQLTDGENIDIVLISDHLAWCKDLGGNVYSVDLSGDGQYVGANTINTAYYFDSDGTKLWNFTNHKYDDLPYVPNQITLVTPSDDGQLVAVDGRYDLFVFDALGESLWNYSTFSTYYGYIKEPEFSRDGNSLVVAPSQREGDSLFKFDKDGNIIWSYECSQTEDDIFYALAISDDGEYIAAYCQNDYTVYFFDGDGTELWHNYPMYVYYEGISMSGDGEYIALSNLDTDLCIYAKNGTLLWKYRPHDVVRDRDCCYHVAVSHDGTHVIADSEYCLHYFDIQGNLLWEHQIGTLIGYSYVSASAISDDGQYVALGIGTGTVILLNRYGDVLWEYETGKPIRSNTGISFSNDGTKLAAASENGYVYFFSTGIRVENHPPKFKYIPEIAINASEIIEFTLSAVDSDSDQLIFTATDLPQGALFDTETCIFNWTPEISQVGNHTIHFEVSDGELIDSADVTIKIIPGNQPPVLDPIEDLIGNMTVCTSDELTFRVNATDADSDALSYSALDLPSGAEFTDQNFTWTPDTSQIGTHTVHFEVSDSDLTDTADVTITVLPGNQPPISSFTVDTACDEGANISFNACTSSDPDDDLISYNWDFGDGETSSGMQVEHLYPSNGEYMVCLTVTDPDGETDTATTTIKVLNIAPDVDAGGDIEVYTNETFALNSSFTDPGILDLHFAFVDWGDGEEESIIIDETEGQVIGDHAYMDHGLFQVNVTVSDDDGGMGSDMFNVTVINRPPFARTNGPYTIAEGTMVIISAENSTDPDGSIVEYIWDIGGDGETDFTGETLEYIWEDDFNSTIVLTVFDDDGDNSSTSTEINVFNVAPTIESLSMPADPVSVGENVYVSTIFVDPGADGITLTWDWGDGDISISECLAPPDTNEIASHIYQNPGVYTLRVVVSDDDGGEDEEISTQYIVVYDPDGGFVTGGGWIESPNGAYYPNPELNGKVTFGFVSKYKKGTDVPTGETEFQFKVADLNFHSTDYQWLLVECPNAKYIGRGTINNHGNYGFMLTATDEKLTSSTDVDLFRIKIWNLDNNDEVVYDNQPGESDDEDLTTGICGGSIVIHNK
ncbi:PKD domain-containing protein [Methanogenium marinum]|uniref:PKD domain-containing protein n=1 Tax=Methanogenium marinum TaxID=348610 RepID=A0A9Q4KRZ2_9EURY|nr:PKD domain-containing protein [Methanogenium marinum]MDE4907622.1 PKD domain-containing protein [Methanogenium marinum]